MSDVDLERERELVRHAACARGGGLAYARPFALTGDAAHYARDLTVDVRHIKLRIRIDPKARFIAGTATHSLSAMNDGVRHIEFDAAEMSISKVSVGGKSV